MSNQTISLTSGMRTNLLSLQQTTVLQNRTQVRLSTGKKVNSSLDDPINYFRALANTNAASDLAAKKDGMSEAIQTVTAGTNGIDSLTDLINQAKSIATSASTATDTGTLATQFNQILSQIYNIAQDSGYGGKNLLNNDSLNVQFNASGSHSLTIQGFAVSQDTTSATIGGVIVANASNGFGSSVTQITGSLDSAIAALRTQSQALSSNLAIVTSRQNFTDNMVNTLNTGADNLTLADMNEEGANMLMLQTRQQLGTTALSLASQAAQAVLRLF
jgi:flagellin